VKEGGKKREAEARAGCTGKTLYKGVRKKLKEGSEPPEVAGGRGFQINNKLFVVSVTDHRVGEIGSVV